MKGVKFGMTRNQLLALPVCKFTEQESRKYASLLIVPAKKLHDSGYRLMAIVGLDKEGKPIEIADFCDDIEWKVPKMKLTHNLDFSPLRTDMYPDIDCIHAWTRHGYFTVRGCSSVEVELVLDEGWRKEK